MLRGTLGDFTSSFIDTRLPQQPTRVHQTWRWVSAGSMWLSTLLLTGPLRKAVGRKRCISEIKLPRLEEPGTVLISFTCMPWTHHCDSIYILLRPYKKMGCRTFFLVRIHVFELFLNYFSQMPKVMVLSDFSAFILSSLSQSSFSLWLHISVYTPILHLSSDSAVAPVPKLNPTLSNSITHSVLVLWWSICKCVNYSLMLCCPLRVVTIYLCASLWECCWPMEK